MLTLFSSDIHIARSDSHGSDIVLLGFCRASTQFSMVAALINILTNSVQRFLFLHPHQQLVVFLFTIAILTKVRFTLTVVLIRISLVAKNIKHFSCLYWPFVFLLSRSV